MSSLRQTSNIEPLQLHHRLPFDLKFFLDPVPPSKQPHFVCSPASSPKSLMPAAQEPPTTHVHPNNLRNALPPHAGLRQATGNLGGPAFAPSFFDLSGAHRTSSMPLLAPAPPRYANHVQVYKRRARWVERPAPSRVGGVTPPPHHDPRHIRLVMNRHVDGFFALSIVLSSSQHPHQWSPTCYLPFIAPSPILTDVAL